jgi:hypothetical protein
VSGIHVKGDLHEASQGREYGHVAQVKLCKPILDGGKEKRKKGVSGCSHILSRYISELLKSVYNAQNRYCQSNSIQ